jgi:hypothetical protein
MTREKWRGKKSDDEGKKKQKKGLVVEKSYLDALFKRRR